MHVVKWNLLIKPKRNDKRWSTLTLLWYILFTSLTWIRPRPVGFADVFRNRPSALALCVSVSASGSLGKDTINKRNRSSHPLAKGVSLRAWFGTKELASCWWCETKATITSEWRTVGEVVIRLLGVLQWRCTFRTDKTKRKILGGCTLLLCGKNVKMFFLVYGEVFVSCFQ